MRKRQRRRGGTHQNGLPYRGGGRSLSRESGRRQEEEGGKIGGGVRSSRGNFLSLTRRATPLGERRAPATGRLGPFWGAGWDLLGACAVLRTGHCGALGVFLILMPCFSVQSGTWWPQASFASPFHRKITTIAPSLASPTVENLSPRLTPLAAWAHAPDRPIWPDDSLHLRISSIGPVPPSAQSSE